MFERPQIVMRARTIFSEDARALKSESDLRIPRYAHLSLPLQHHTYHIPKTSRHVQELGYTTALHKHPVESRGVRCGSSCGSCGVRWVSRLHSPSGLFTRRSDTHCGACPPSRCLRPPARLFSAPKSRIPIHHRNRDRRALPRCTSVIAIA